MPRLIYSNCATHRRLESMFDNYHYQTLTTREAENLAPGFRGKQYLQDYVEFATQ